MFYLIFWRPNEILNNTRVRHFGCCDFPGDKPEGLEINMATPGKKYSQGGTDAFVVHIRGDKTKQPEPSEHRIHFPGGYIGVSRTSDDEYWAHIAIHREFDGDDEKIPGRLVDARIDQVDKATMEANLGDLTSETLEHLAIRIAPAETWLRDGRPASYGK